jgi:hypothetical protein
MEDLDDSQTLELVDLLFNCGTVLLNLESAS